MKAAETIRSDRRADIDYLRVAALLLLIVYHSLLVYNSWDWWRVKSSYAGPWADYITGVLTPWRMALVFFIGGVAARFMIDRTETKSFIAERASKLLTAFVFAVIVIVPLQRYVRLDETGHQPENYIHYLLHDSRFAVQDFGIWLPDFAHAWFLPYLFVYSVLGVMFVRMTPRAAAWLQAHTERLPLWALLGSVMTLFAISESLILPRFPTTGLLVADIGAHTRFAPLFLLGLMIGRSTGFTQKLLAHKTRIWILAAMLLALTIVTKSDYVDYGPSVSAGNTLWLALRGLFGGAMLFSALAFAAWALNRPSPALTYATDAILPVYLMHQTILVVAADAIVPLRWPLPIELIALIGATGLIPLLVYHVLVRNTPALRVLFGLRPHARPAHAATPEKPPHPMAQPLSR